LSPKRRLFPPPPPPSLSLSLSSSSVAKIVEGRAERKAWPRHSLARSLKPRE